MAIRCGSCRLSHDTVADVRSCYDHAADAAGQAEAECLAELTVLDGFGSDALARQVMTEARRQSHIPDSRYALVDGPDGNARFYGVNTPEHGKWRGFTFVVHLVGRPGAYAEYPVKGEWRALTLAALAVPADAEAAARLYGRLTDTCGRCGSELSNVQSRCAGYGETCAGHLGWYYPSLAEALAWEQTQVAMT